MTYFHVVKAKFYRCGYKFNTAVRNWGSAVPLQENRVQVCDEIFRISAETGASISDLVNLCNWFSDTGSLQRSIAAYRVYQGSILSDQDISKFFDFYRVRPKPFLSAQDGLELWEHLHEYVRTRFFAEAPSRRDSCFSFERLSEARKFQKEQQEQTVICSLMRSKYFDPVPYDRNLIDQVDPLRNYEEAEKILKLYWNGEKSSRPVIEYLMQGELTYGGQFRP